MLHEMIQGNSEKLNINWTFQSNIYPIVKCSSSTEGVQKWLEQRHPMWYYRTWNRRQLILVVGKRWKIAAKSKKFTLNSIVSIFFSRFLYCRLIPSQKSLLLGNDYYIIRTYVLYNPRVNQNFQKKKYIFKIESNSISEVNFKFKGMLH